MNKKFLIVIALLAVVVASGIAFALFYVTSNVVHVSMNYTVNLSTTVSGSVVTLAARVEYQGNPQGAMTVNFYESPDGSAWTQAGTWSSGAFITTNSAAHALF